MSTGQGEIRKHELSSLSNLAVCGAQLCYIQSYCERRWVEKFLQPVP